MQTGKIDIKKSIDKMRLVERLPVIDVVLNFLCYVITLSYLPLIFYITLRENAYEFSGAAFLKLLTLFIFSIFIVYRFMKIWRLREVKVADEGENRKLLREAAKKLGWHKVKDSKEIMILSVPGTFFGLRAWDGGREIVILYNKNVLLINCASFGRGVKSPYHWIGNRNTENKIIDELKRLHLESVKQ